jgi:hypothetical protein
MSKKTKYHEILEPYLNEELISGKFFKKNNSDVSVKNEILYFTVDLIEREYQVEMKQLKGQNYDFIYDNKSHIYSASYEEALMLVLSQFQEERDTNIDKVKKPFH